MADSGRISGPVSVLLRSVLKTIATDELNLRQLVQDALLPEPPPGGTRHSTQATLPFRERGSSSAVLLKSQKAQLAVFRETAT